MIRTLVDELVEDFELVNLYNEKDPYTIDEYLMAYEEQWLPIPEVIKDEVRKRVNDK